MAHTIQLPWGKDSLSVRLPEKWQVLGELRPKSATRLASTVDACAEALKDPIGTGRLSSRDLSGTRVVLVVDDHSRPTPVREFIHPILNELALAGVKDESIDILIATGVHRASRPEEMEAKLGVEVMARFRWHIHDAYRLRGGGLCGY